MFTVKIQLYDKHMHIGRFDSIQTAIAKCGFGFNVISAVVDSAGSVARATILTNPKMADFLDKFEDYVIMHEQESVQVHLPIEELALKFLATKSPAVLESDTAPAWIYALVQGLNIREVKLCIEGPLSEEIIEDALAVSSYFN